MSESGRRAVVIAPSALGSKDLPAGLSKVPWRESAAIFPPQRIRRRNVEVKDPWRGSRHDNLLRSPSMASRNKVWTAEGVSTFSLGVLVWRHGIHITPPVLVVLELALHQNSDAMESGTKRTNTSSKYKYFQWRFA